MERYELTPLTLFEDHFPAHLAYGRWDWVFGCWLAESRNGPLRAITPTWPLLKPDGTAASALPRLRVSELNEHVPEKPPIPRLGLRVNAKTSDPPLSVLATAALNQYVALVPIEVRSMVAPLGAFQWLLLEAIHTVPAFEQFARVSMETKRSGFFIAAWCLASAHTLPSGKRRELNRAIMTTPRRQLLERLSGAPFGSAALSCIYKVEPTRLNASLIRRIAALVENRALRSRLAMTRRISPALLDHIGQIPESLLHPGLLGALAEIDDVECPYNLVSELKALVEKDRESAGTSAVDSLKRVRDAEGLVEAIARLKERIAAQKPFPAPPVVRSTSLRPLMSVGELRRVAREMQSCVRTYGPAVHARHSYVCAWLGRERATVELVRGPGGRWTLGAFAGRNNRPLSIGTVVEIASTVAQGLNCQHSGTKQDLQESPAPGGSNEIGP